MRWIFPVISGIGGAAAPIPVLQRAAAPARPSRQEPVRERSPADAANDRDPHVHRPELRLIPAVVLVVLAAVVVSRLFYPFDVGIYEANNWAPAQLLVAGRNPYALEHALRPPYTVATYGPLYYLLIGLGVKFFGLQLWFGRLLSVAGAAAAVWGAARLAGGLSGRREAGVWAAAALAAQFPLQFWIAAQRPDLVALGFSLAGLTVALSAARRGSHAFFPVAGAALLLAAAFHCRQTSLLAAVLAGAWLLRAGGGGLGLGFGVTFGAACLLPALLLDWTSAGGYSEQLWRMPAALPRRAEVLLVHLSTLAQGPQFWVLCLGYLAGGEQTVRGGGPEPQERFFRRTLVVYAAVSLAAALLTSSIPGSNVNYYLEACAAMAVCFPLAFPQGEGRLFRAGLVVLGLGAVLSGARVGRGEVFRWQALPYYREVVRKIESLTTVGDAVYSDYPELVSAAGRAYYFNTIVPYDGRAPRLRGILAAVYDAGTLRLIADQSPQSPRGYRRVELALPAPRRVYPVYLHLRNDRPSENPDER